MAFLRNLLASILGTIIALGILFMFLMLIGSLAGAADKGIQVKNQSILELSLEQPLKDYGGTYRLVDFNIREEQYDGLNALLPAIKAAKTDPKIEGISIKNAFFMGGTASLKALRDALLDFKESGKFVYAYGDLILQNDYYLASVADSVFLNPAGELDFRGLSSEVLYLKDLQEKSGVRMEVIRHGKYKSAVEPYLSNEMSEENRLQIGELLSSVWSVYRKEIASSRGIQESDLDELANALGARTPQMALQNKFVDALWYEDQYDALLRKKSGLGEKDDLRLLELEKYAEANDFVPTGVSRDRIAIIYAQGQIGYGEGSDTYIGQGIINEALREAREDDQVKAVVVRVNSPGGVALTSELIWREMELTKAVKPLVVSMGDLAASGGYFMAMAGDHIIAEPTTITGSIGVFATIPNVSGLAESWGVNAEQVNTHKHATFYSLFEEPSEDFKRFSEEQIEAFYQDFIGKVANARNMSVEEVDAIAQGRVWTGVQALENGLVDALGGMDDAVAYAAEAAGISSFRIREYPVYETDLEKLLSNLGFGYLNSGVEKELQKVMGTQLYDLYEQVQMNEHRKGLQARLPFEIRIR